MTKDVRRALLVARRMFAGGGDTTTTTVSPGVSVSSKGSNKSGESTVAKPADKLPLQEPLPATTVNYQNLLPSNMGLLTPASAPGGGLPNVPGFTAGPSGFGSLVPASASLTQPFGAMPMGSPNLGAPTPSIGASTAPMAGFSNPSLAQATFNYAPEKYVPKPLEPTPSPFTTAATAPGTTTAEKDENADFVDGWSGAQGSSGGDVGESSARGGAINEHPHTHAMDPRDLPGIHVRTAHTFAAGGAATQGQGQDQDEGEGFDAYHGSPHAFERFDPSNIGTGEGSQAFGHGLYFAEKKRTAQDYQDRLRPNDWFAQRSRKLMEQYGDWGQAVDKIISMYHESPKKKEIFRQSLLKEGPPTGHLYHVRIKANPEHFLDWDAPIQEQPDVWWKLSKLVSDKAHGPEEVGPDKKRIPWSTLLQDMEENDKMTGSDIHRLLTHPEAIGFHPEQAAQALHAAGIPGIKYWDAGSRREGQGTRNYVIFNPDIIHVKRRYADGGLIQDKYPSHYMPGVGRQVMRTGGEPSNPLEEYRDPESKRMAGWDWAPLSQVHESLGSFKEIPSHVEAFGDFMNETAKKAATTGLTPRDLIKAYVITRSSIQREGRRPEKVLEHWPDFPGPTDKIIRPEGAMGEWLQTPMGQRYLDSAVKGNVDHDAVQDAMRAMRSFGMTEKGEAQALPYAAKMLPGQEGRVSDMVARAIHSDSAPQEWRDWATKLHGIKYAKSGFLASMLGRGDQPTADARQYNVHSGMAPGKERNKLIDKAQVDSVLRLAARQRALNIGMPSALTPHYQHLVHHTVWDKAGNDVTTHEDLINAMRHAADGGEINETPIHQHVLAHAMRAAGLPGLGRQVMADGGDPGSDPLVQKAMDVAQQAQPAPVEGAMGVAKRVAMPGRARFEIAPARGAIAAPMAAGKPNLTEPGSVNIKSLSEASRRAIENHLALPPEKKIANFRNAENNVAKFVGRGKSGKINSVLTANKKLMKAQTAGEGETPLTLPDGRTLEMTGLALMPDYREGQFRVCGNSGVCRDLCLGKKSGQYRFDPTATQSEMPTTKEQIAESAGRPRVAALKRTMAMLRDPESFAVYLHELIDGAQQQAERRGSHLGVRLNVLSDLSPKILEPIIKANPLVSFYDYTKMNYNPVAPNHHYTYSSTGLSQPDRGVENPFSNWRQMRDRLDQGSNVAMAFAHGKGEAFPEMIHDAETGRQYRVVSGDEHDFRPLDMVPEGEPGTIIALKNMAASSPSYKYEEAARGSHGFFVHHDPDFLKNNRGTFAKDENGKRIPRNKVYTVAVQPQKRGASATPQEAPQ